MARPSALIAIALAALAVAAAFAQTSGSGRGGTELASAQSYAGSVSCQRCHEPEYQSWRSSLHVQMTRPIAEANVAGDFRSGTRLDGPARAYAMDARDGRYFISITRAGGSPEQFEINYTLGARRFQGYLSKLPDGRIYVLPVFWHNESKRWVDYKEITPIPDDPQHDLRQIWNVSCVNCHATNLVRNFDVRSNTFATTWTEMGIGCEACHGPGREHIDDPDHQKIFTMKKVPPRQVFDACGYCHGNKTNVFFGFKPGDRYEDYALPFLISEPIPDNDPQGDFWPDGRPSRFNRPQALTLTGCFRSGQATCTSCHRMHGTENNHALKVNIDAPGGGHTRESDTLCTQCHAASASEGGHTHHAPTSQGSRCINCHMSDVNWRLITRRLDHTFQPPVPEMTARYGVPNACTTCHEDKSPEWAAAKVEAWYGNGERRRAVVALADTMYRAGSGDVSVLPQIASLAIDRSRGTLIRASAAQFAGQLIARAGEAGGAGPLPPAIVNALIGAANDSDATVRITAVRTLGFVDEPRVLSVLAAHLTDSARVARVSAAEALMSRGVTALDGVAGQVLARVQDEWIESLRSFGDVSSDHTTLGWLRAARGQGEEAANELNAAIRLDPGDARPHVYLGVLAAREGRFEDALQRFRTAKTLSPAYRNLDRLIEEAEKRVTKRH